MARPRWRALRSEATAVLIALVGCSSTGATHAGGHDAGTSQDGAHVNSDAHGRVQDADGDGPIRESGVDSPSISETGVDAGFDAGACAAVDAGAPPPSCMSAGAGLSDCGRCHEGCCLSLEVPGGPYDRTYDLTDAGDPAFPPDGGPTGLADPATLSGFRLDKYVVTVGRFRKFVAAWTGGYTPTPGSGKHTHINGGLGLANSGASTLGRGLDGGAVDAGDAGDGHEPGWLASDNAFVAPTTANLACYAGYATWTPSPEGQETLPVNCVTWQEAYAFCIWDGGFLPSEAEWEYAAAGGAEQRPYAWGVTPPGTNSAYAIFGCDYPGGATDGICTGVANIAAVGTASLGVGRWGQLDLGGELYQWNLDWYAAYASPCVDCAYMSSTSNRVIRGGYFGYDSTFLLPSNRGNYPEGRANGVGFRCARVP